MDEALDLVLGKLQGVAKRGGYWMARCPAHDDGKSSLSVARGTEQPVVFKCHAGCRQDEIIAALGLPADVISKPREQRDRDEWTPHGPAIAVYDYADEHGDLLFQVLRTADKQFPQRHKSPEGKWVWRTGGVRKVPYRLPKLIAAVAAGERVYVVEGEKDVQSVERAGAVATCSPGGAGKWRDEYDSYFTGADVIIVADRDQPGRDHAADVLAHLRDLAKSAVIAEAAEGKDVTDHLDAGHSLDELAPLRPASRALAVIDLEPATEHIDPPSLICGDLLYLGGVHTLSGPPDCGKTTLACWWMLECVRRGGRVLFLDEEGGREVVSEKFQALGARPGERIGYAAFPGRSWTTADLAMLSDVLTERRPDMVAWDSSAAFLARAGLDENAAADVTGFYARVLTPAARLHNAAVLVIDHDTKNGEASRYARGSGAKLAATDVAFKIAPVKPFSIGESGVSTLTVSKDRRGWLHRSHECAFISSDVTLSVRVTQSAPPGEDDGDLGPADKKVLGALDSRPRSIPELTERIALEHGHGLRRETMSRSLNKLMRLGLSDKIAGNQGHDHWMATNGR